MKKLIAFVIAGLALIACSSEETQKTETSKESLKRQIKEMDDSLKGLYKQMMSNPDFQFPTLAINEAIYRNLAYYKRFPKDAYSAACLDKVQQLYMQQKRYYMSLNYTDSLLLKYPNYPKKPELLLNAGSTGEMMQDTAIIRKYYSKLLNDCPNITAETKEMVEFRLKNLKLSFDELIELQIKNTSK